MKSKWKCKWLFGWTAIELREELRWRNEITDVGIVLKTVGIEEVTLVGGERT